MRVHALLLLLLPSSALFAQQAPPAAVSCSADTSAPTDGSRALAAERYAEAETFYAAQMNGKPSITVYAGLVDAQIQLDKVDQALSTAKQAVAALPNSGEAQALLGDAQLRASHIDEATAAYTAAIKLDKCSARAHFGYGRIEGLYSRHASEQKQYALAHRLTPADTHISEVTFATLPPALHAKGLRNLLASATDLPPAHRQHLEQQAALLEAGAICRPAQMDGAKLPLTPIFFNGVRTRDYALRVSTGGSTPVNLELDSTAAGIVLSENDAKKLNVHPAVNGQTTAPYLGYVDSVQIGPMQFAKCSVSVVSDSDLGHRYSVIGTSFFRDFRVHLDWVAKLMTLNPYPGTPVLAAEAAPMDAVNLGNEQGWSHALIDDNRILVPAMAEKRPVGLVMLDTSNTLNMLAPSAAIPFKPTMDQTINVEGVSGSIVRIFRKDGGGNANESDVIGLDGVPGGLVDTAMTNKQGGGGTERISSIASTNGKNVPIKIVGASLAVAFAGNQPPDFALYSFDISAASHAAGLEIGGIVGYTVLRQYFIDIDYRNGVVNLTYDQGFPLRSDIMKSQ
jgi:tetratricopeptide (TPR) repeat protein